MEASVEKLSKMLTYLGRESFVIPHQGLPLPFQADGDNYRPEKIFRIFRNGLMEYRGWGLAYSSKIHPALNKLDITIGGIQPTQRWLIRAQAFLVDEVRDKVLSKILTSKMKNIGNLILKFNGLDFIELDP